MSDVTQGISLPDFPGIEASVSSGEVNPSSLLSLTDEALCRIFFLLDPPFPRMRSHSFRLKDEYVANASALAALSQTCRRLHILNKKRAVRCIDLSRICRNSIPRSDLCCCGVAAALVERPGTCAAVLGMVRTEHSEVAFGGEAKVALGRLHGIQLLVSPARAVDSDLLVSAVPALQHLILDFTQGSLAYSNDAEREALLRLLEKLPLGLRRVEITRFDQVGDIHVQEALWRRLPELTELEGVILLCMGTVSEGAVTALRKSPKLRSLDLEAESWGCAPSPTASELVAALPPGIRDLFLCCGSQSGCEGEQSLALKDDCFKRLRHLNQLTIGNMFFPDWAVLRPVARDLRKLSVGSVPVGSYISVGALDVLRTMQSLWEIEFIGVCGVDDAVAAGLFSSANLQRAQITDCDISDSGMAAALLGAACASSLRELDLHNDAGDERESEFRLGDETAVAAGNILGRLEKLNLWGADISHVGVAAIKQGCPSLTELFTGEIAHHAPPPGFADSTSDRPMCTQNGCRCF